MISELVLKFGSAPGTAPSPIAVTPVTVFVGPNNSGKSRILAEIQRFASQGSAAQNDVIIERLTFEGFAPRKQMPQLEILLCRRHRVKHSRWVISSLKAYKVAGCSCRALNC